MRRELVRAVRERRPLAIILVDVDHFKRLNDTFGHIAGDAILKEIGKRLQSGVRVYDGIGRYGGEEFLLALPGCDLKPALARAELLRSHVSGNPVVVSSNRVTVTVSLGVTVTLGSSDGGLEDALQRADEALYAAKKKGRNRVEVLAQAHKTNGSNSFQGRLKSGQAKPPAL